jgi:hypothetical protein
LYRKSKGTKAYLGNLLMENRHGLILDAMATHADGTAERDGATLMLHEQGPVTPRRRRTIAADKNDDTHAFVDISRELGVTPHVTQNVSAGAAARLTRARPDTKRMPSAKPAGHVSSRRLAG